MKYLLDEIQEFANKIADDIITLIVVKDAEEAIVDAAIKAENEGASQLTLDVLASGVGLAAIVPNALNVLPISYPLAKVAQALSAAQISQASADDEYTWELCCIIKCHRKYFTNISGHCSSGFIIYCVRCHDTDTKQFRK